MIDFVWKFIPVRETIWWTSLKWRVTSFSFFVMITVINVAFSAKYKHLGLSYRLIVTSE